jgi:hypothetical protein
VDAHSSTGPSPDEPQNLLVLDLPVISIGSLESLSNSLRIGHSSVFEGLCQPCQGSGVSSIPIGHSIKSARLQSLTLHRCCGPLLAVGRSCQLDVQTLQSGRVLSRSGLAAWHSGVPAAYRVPVFLWFFSNLVFRGINKLRGISPRWEFDSHPGHHFFFVFSRSHLIALKPSLASI